MSLIGKKVIFTLPTFDKNGQLSESKVETISGEIVDKVFTSYPNPADPHLAPLQYDMYIVRKDNGDCLPLNPSYITQIPE